MDLVLKRLATITISIVEKLLMLTGEVGIGTRTATITPTTQLTMVDCCIYLLLIVALTKLFTTMKEVILRIIMEDMELYHKRTATITFTMVDKVLMIMGEVDISLR